MQSFCVHALCYWTAPDLSDMADDGNKGRRTFRKFSYRGVDLDQLLDMSTDELVELFPARARRRWGFKES